MFATPAYAQAAGAAGAAGSASGLAGLLQMAPFLIALGCLALVMTFLIVGQTLSAAMANPVKNLKEE